jgi:TrpR-related protein YerC/YecD
MKKSNTNNWNQHLEQLCKGVLSIKTDKEMHNFLTDLCTKTELQAISERLQAAKLIKAGTPYRDISKQTGLSTTTVTRISNWIKQGEQGYNTVLERLEQ